MNDPTPELFAGLEAPLPLSAALRGRLEEALLAPADRALPHALRSGLERRLTRPRRLRVAAQLVAAAAALVVGVVVALPDRGPAPTVADGTAASPTATPSPVATPGLGALSGGTTTTQGAGAGAAAAPPVGAPRTSPAATLADRGGATTSTGGTVGSAPAPSPALAAAKPAPPTLTSVAPASARVGTWVVLTGTALLDPTKVLFSDTVATQVQVQSSTRVRVLVPSRVPGPVDVTVNTAGGRSNAVTFTLLP